MIEQRKSKAGTLHVERKCLPLRITTRDDRKKPYFNDINNFKQAKHQKLRVTTRHVTSHSTSFFIIRLHNTLHKIKVYTPQLLYN